MKFTPIALFAFLCALSSPAWAEDALSSRYASMSNCTEIGDGDALDEDWIAYRCVSFDDIPVWVNYSDSARSHIGFGPRRNLSGPFGLSARDKSWRIEWRGVARDGRFEPFAAILRLRRPEIGLPTDGRGLLFVFRLREDGTSCMVAADLASNEVARKAADRSLPAFECLSEPQTPGA